MQYDCRSKKTQTIIFKWDKLKFLFPYLGYVRLGDLSVSNKMLFLTLYGMA